MKELSTKEMKATKGGIVIDANTVWPDPPKDARQRPDADNYIVIDANTVWPDPPKE